MPSSAPTPTPPTSPPATSACIPRALSPSKCCRPPANATAFERTIVQLAGEPAPDDPTVAAPDQLSAMQLCPRRRR
ncbi:hypothetical protein [Streptomyces chrestomyceticus]|uniref:hypothetical protein n=1 Tax=Streptomyces chrestomyceticus TaxID=68185 RepID=UPI003797AE30